MGRLGTCPICMSLSVAFLALSLLVYGLGASLPLFPIAVAGLVGAVIFGPLSILHGIFYLLRPKAVDEPVQPNPVRPVTIVRHSCCGGWS